MTNAEAIKIINQYDCNFYWTDGEKIPTEDLIEAFELAVKALDAQEPIKPVSTGFNHLCGRCNAVIYRQNKFCPFCGQEAKWE